MTDPRIIIIGSGYSQPFRCQSSSDQSGLVYTPNIPDFYFNDVNAADFRRGRGSNLTDTDRDTTFFFTVPTESVSHNCSGDAVSIQYCYRARNSDRNEVTTVFNLLAVDRNGLQFTIISSTNIQTTPQDSISTDPGGSVQQICCDTTPLSGFQIPSSEYTFSIVTTSSRNVRPLAFANSVREYRVEQYSDRLGNNGPSPGSTVTLRDRDKNNDHALLLMRFIIGKL